jgi:hypothetical protein
MFPEVWVIMSTSHGEPRQPGIQLCGSQFSLKMLFVFLTSHWLSITHFMVKRSRRSVVDCSTYMDSTARKVVGQPVLAYI